MRVAEEARLVDAANPVAHEGGHRQPVARRELPLVERVEEVERAFADEEHRVEYLLHLHRHQRVEAVARDEAELHGGLAQAQRVARRRLAARRELLLVEHAQLEQRLAEPLVGDRGARGDDVPGVEVDRPSRLRVEHHELALPRGLPEEGRDVAEHAGRVHLPREQDSARVERTGGFLPEEHQVRRRREHVERALAPLHAHACRFADRRRHSGRRRCARCRRVRRTWAGGQDTADEESPRLHRRRKDLAAAQGAAPAAPPAPEAAAAAVPPTAPNKA